MVSGGVSHAFDLYLYLPDKAGVQGAPVMRPSGKAFSAASHIYIHLGSCRICTISSRSIRIQNWSFYTTLTTLCCILYHTLQVLCHTILHCTILVELEVPCHIMSSAIPYHTTLNHTRIHNSEILRFGSSRGLWVQVRLFGPKPAVATASQLLEESSLVQGISYDPLGSL